MGYSSEIKAKLGIDTSSVDSDLNGATNSFRRWSKRTEDDSQAAGTSYGEKFGAALERRLIGTRALSTGIATALGLSIDKFSDAIAAAWVKGTKQGWEEAGKLADQDTELIGQIAQNRMSPEQKEANFKSEMDRAKQGLSDLASKRKDPLTDKPIAGYQYSAEDLKQYETLTIQLHKAELDYDKQHEENVKRLNQLNKENEEAVLANSDIRSKAINLELDLKTIQEQINNGSLSGIALAEKKSEAIKKQAELTRTLGEIERLNAEQKQKDDDRALQATESVIKQRELATEKLKAQDDLQHDQDKIADRYKLTIAELANLKGGTSSLDQSANDTQRDFEDAANFGADQNLSFDQINARNQARQVQRLESQAEKARLAGDQQGTTSALTQAGQIREQLRATGAIKSTEGDPNVLYLKKISEDQTHLNEIVDKILVAAQGKLANE